MSSVHDYVGALRPHRSAFNLSNTVQFDCNPGELIPVFFREVYPGDVIKYGEQCVVRTGAWVAPSYVGLQSKVDLFYMSSKNLMGANFDIYFKDHAGKRTENHTSEGDFVDFITGGENGESTVTLPRWNDPDTSAYSLWDYFQLPVGVTPNPLPIDFPRRMYNAVWNEYYRNENIQDIIPSTNQKILNRNWKRDRFTSALPFQQRGQNVAIPLAGDAPVILGDGRVTKVGIPVTAGYRGGFPENQPYLPASSLRFVNYAGVPSGDTTLPIGSGNGNSNAGVYIPTSAQAFGEYPVGFYVNNNGTPELSALQIPNYIFNSSHALKADLSQVSSFDVSDLRFAFQLQKWRERNARGGVRYVEFLRSHFGVAPIDEVLQRPVHISSTTGQIIVSEIAQTGATDGTSPQGNLAGHALGADRGFVGSFRVKEHGYIMALFSIVPSRGAYFQGVPRELLRQTNLDFFFPEFANLSEQAITQEEIYASQDEKSNKIVFGFEPRYQELRCATDSVMGGFRSYYLHWTFARNFGQAPNLNKSFIELSAENDQLNRVFAVQTDPDTNESIRNFLVNFGNIVKAIRPIPYMSEPGLIDHH